MPRSIEEQALTSHDPARYGNDKKVAAYMDISIMTLHRLRKDPALGFPMACRVMGAKRTSFDEIDEWIRSRRQNAD